MVESNKADNFKGAIGGRWEEGESGNPAGRPPGSLTTLLRQYLEQGENKANKQQVIKALVDLAQSIGSPGQVSAIREIFDRVDGKVVDRHQIEALIITPGNIEEARKLLIEDKTEELLLIQAAKASQTH